MRTTGKSLHVKRLRVVPIDAVSDSAQPGEIGQPRHFRGSAGHSENRAIVTPRAAARPYCAEMSDNLPPQFHHPTTKPAFLRSRRRKAFAVAVAATSMAAALLSTTSAG